MMSGKGWKQGFKNPPRYTPHYYQRIVAATGAYVLALGAGVFTVTGQPMRMLAGRKMDLLNGTFTFTGQPMGMKAGRRLDLVKGTFTLTGSPIGMLCSRKLSLESSAFIVNGGDVQMKVGRMLALEPGSFIFTGYDCDLIYSGGGAIGRPKRREWMRRLRGGTS